MDWSVLIVGALVAPFVIGAMASSGERAIAYRFGLLVAALGVQAAAEYWHTGNVASWRGAAGQLRAQNMMWVTMALCAIAAVSYYAKRGVLRLFGKGKEGSNGSKV